MAELIPGTIIEVHGYVMLNKLNPGKYRIDSISKLTTPTYDFTRPRGKNVIIRHFVKNVDPWLRDTNHPDLNKIVVLKVPPWTRSDDVAGFRQGWGLFQRSDNGRLELSKLDDPQGVAADFDISAPKEFKDDAAAAQFVQKQADKGDVVCRKAIEELMRHKSKDVKNFNLRRTWK